MPKKFLLLIGFLCLSGMARADEAPPLPETGSQSSQPRMDKTSKEFKQVYDLAGEVYVDKGLRVSGPFAFLSSSGTINYVDITTMTVSSLTVTGTFTAVRSSTNACGYIIGSVVQSSFPITSGGTSTGTGSTYASTKLSSQFTPLCASDTVLIHASGSLGNANPSGANTVATVFSGAGDLDSTSTGLCGYGNSGVVTELDVPCSMDIVNNPATIATQTYTVKVKNSNGAAVSWLWGFEGSQRMTILEIAK